MTYLVSYDISSDRVRNRLAKMLQKKQGQRLQKSLFVLEVRKHHLQELKDSIHRITGGEGSVMLFRQCQGCKDKGITNTKEDLPSAYIY